MTEDNRVTLKAEQRGRLAVITRVFDAPQELVFKMYIGQKECSTAVDDVGVRFSGDWRYVQRGRDGNKITYKDV